MTVGLSAKNLLQQYGETKQIEIERLLSQYGTSLQETKEMYPQLLQGIEQRKLAYTFPTQELFFTPSEAAQMGVSLQEDWMLKMTPQGEDYGISFISPQKWEITERGSYISPEGTEYNQADLEALLSVPTGGMGATAYPLTTEDLTEAGQQAYQGYLESGGALDIADWIELQERQQLETEQVFGAAFPQQDVDEVLTYMSEDPEGFLADIREIGPTEEMVSFLKTLEFGDEQGNVRHLTDTEIQELFSPTTVPEYIPESKGKDMRDAFLAGGVGLLHGLETFFFTHPPSPPSETLPYPVGTHTTAIAPEWQAQFAQAQYEDALQNTIDGYLRRRAEQQEFWISHPHLTPKPEYLQNPWEHTELFKDPGYWGYSIMSSLAYSLAVMGTIIGVSAIATPFAGIPAGLIVAGIPEAGNMIDELVDMGVPIEQAREPATLYGLAVGGIETVSDLPFIGLIFKPIGAAVKPMWNTVFKGVASRLGKKILTGLLIPQIEGVEELVTQVIHNAILKNYDETQSLMEGVSHAYIQGVIASTPFGVIGGKASFNTFYDRLSSDMQKQYDQLVERFENAGLTTQEAQVQAANELAKTPEGEAELSEAIEAAQTEYREEHPIPEPITYELSSEVLRDISERFPKKIEPTPPPIMTGQPYTATVYRGYKIEGKPTDEGLFGKGTYYTTNQEYAETYDGKEVMSVNLKNPFVLNSHQEAETFWNEHTRPVREQALNEGKTVQEADELAAQAARAWLESQGYDGLIARDIIEKGDEIVVFDTKKSVGAKVPIAEAGMAEVTREYKGLTLRYEPNKSGKKLYEKYGGDYIRAYDKNGVEVGSLFYSQDTPQSDLGLSVGVNPEYQRQGVATAMVRMAQDITGRGIAAQRGNEMGQPFLESLERTEYIPQTPQGMPEAGLQPSMLEEVPAKEVRPEARGKLVQSRMDDYLRLREYNKERATDRISEIKKILETKGRTPKGEATRGNLRLELARLEALQEVEAIEIVEEIDHLIRQVANELGNRSLPYHGAAKNIFPEYTTRQLEEQLKVYEQARQRLSPEIPATSVIKADDIPTDISPLTGTQLTPRQIEKTIDLFKEAVAAPGSEAQRAAALELRKHVFAQRARSASESAEAMIAEGMNPEEAIRTAEQQFMAGKLPDVTTDYFNDLTQEMRNVLFGKVYNYWSGKSWTELISTFEALTNALAGRSIPRVKGIGTKYFPDGGSAWDRLARVFIGDMEVLEALDQGKSLSDIIEGVYLETGRGSVPLNQDTVNWLKGLSEITAEDRLRLEKPLSEITETDVKLIAESWFYRRRQELQTLLTDGVINEEEYKLQLAIAKDRVFPHKAMAPGVSYPEGMFDQLPLLTFREKGTITRTLKSVGMTIIDIGNLMRANLASFDMSFWRQVKTLVPGNPGCFYRSNIEAWRSLFSEQTAEANWEWVKRQPSFPYYTEMVRRTGQDFLRMLEAPKGTAQWQAAEEFGYLTGERAIPRFTARIPWIKVSGRAFVTGTNTMTILTYNKCLEATLRRADMIATGKIKLEEGEGFSIQQEMDDYGKSIAWMTQRASLGKARALAPEISSLFFAPRSKLGRFLTPKLLIDSNPRVRAFAWKNLSLFVGTISSFVMLGYWLGLWNVERDPRNAEFMSIRIGNLRIDPWSGNRQFLVLYSRLISGTGLSSVTGQEYEVNPIGALTSFLRTSLAPLSSILLDFWTGKNFLGEEVDIKNPKQWIDRIAPFAVQDMYEAFQDDWQNGLISILPSIFGEGVQTYTGDWKENWQKLGLPKYLENTGYGIYEPTYDLADFWADTASQLRGVDPSTLTESKGYPEYVRSIAETLQIIESIETLPNKRLASLNADPEEGTTFKDYYQMWQERQQIVASGDKEALKEFDADERTRNAYLGNMTQSQYALLMEYHSLPESEQAGFLGNHPEIYINPREDWLRSHPEENALLALWDKAKVYSEDALGKISSLAQSLGIPESAMIARDPDVVTLLRLQHKGLFDLLDVYAGLDDDIKDTEGLTARDRAVQELYANNPGFRDDMRRIEALSEGTGEDPTPEDMVEAWVNRGIVVDEYGASSAEAKLWLIDNREAHQWALGQALLSDDGSDWNEPVLRLQVQYGEDFDLYDAYGDMGADSYISDDDQRAEARRRLLFDDQGMTSFGKAYYTRAASSRGYSESNWPAFVEYSQLPTWGSWRERFLLDNLSFYKEYTDVNIGNHPLVDTSKIKPVARDKIYLQFENEFQGWDETGGMAPKAIENMRAELDAIERGGLTFRAARYSVQAYDNNFPENLINAYVEWYSDIQFQKDYNDDWWLMDHPEFYKKMYALGVWTEERDFSKVPTREVYALYQTYQSLPSGNPRYDFRAKHPDLDAWLVLKFGYKPIEGRGEAEAEATPWEELAEVKQFQSLF